MQLEKDDEESNCFKPFFSQLPVEKYLSKWLFQAYTGGFKHDTVEEILHHQTDGWNPINIWKSWMVETLWWLKPWMVETL